MFWGVTIESGKKYSQIVEASYHLSMAALEANLLLPRETSKFVSVMLEHQKSDFVLCTLEHGKSLQANLDLMFEEGEEVTFYLSGEGTVHLTGYLVGDMGDDSSSSDEEETEQVPATKSPQKSPKIKGNTSAILATVNDSEDEDDDDWSPSAVLNASGKRPLTGSENNSAKKSKNDATSPDKKLNLSKNGKALFAQKDESSDDDDDDDDDDFSDLDSDDISDLEDGDMEGDENDEEEDDDDDDSEDGDDSAINPFGINKKNAGETPVSSKKKKKQQQQQQIVKGQTPQGNKQQQQKNQTPQSGKGNKQQLNTSQQQQSGKKNQNQNTPQQSGKKNQKENTPQQSGKKNKSPNQQQNQLSNKKGKGGAENSFNGGQTPGGKKQKKQDQQQTPSNNQLNKSQQQTPKTGGKAKKVQGGVQVEDLLEGKGPVAKPGKYVHVYYTGKLPNNKEFDSLTKGKPFGFRLGKGEVIKGWDVALDGMKVGGKRKIVVPPSMGYGGKSTGPIPANSTLHFEVELKAVQ